MEKIILHGAGLHSGAPCSVALRRGFGEVRFVNRAGDATCAELEVVRADHGVQVRAPAIQLELDLVEHLLGALAGLSVRRGIAIEVDGPEVPLLDGGARELALALAALSPPRSPPKLRVAQAGDVHVGASRYTFEPAEDVCIEVQVEFDGIGPERASWDGSPERFLAEIAPARTFGFRRDAAGLRARGRAAHVDPRAVIVLEDDGSVAPPAEPRGDGELARHKLLDLLGDCFLFGGPARGRLVAFRPGHAATQRAIRQALEYGLLVRD